jgi:DNA-binding NarL/FixJ family response regulator
MTLDSAVDQTLLLLRNMLGTAPTAATGHSPHAEPAHPRRTDALTARERDVLRLLTDGKSNAAIADQLSIGSRTVETHVARILEKLGVRSRSAAVAIAVQERF